MQFYCPQKCPILLPFLIQNIFVAKKKKNHLTKCMASPGPGNNTKKLSKLVLTSILDNIAFKVCNKCIFLDVLWNHGTRFTKVPSGPLRGSYPAKKSCFLLDIVKMLSWYPKPCGNPWGNFCVWRAKTALPQQFWKGFQPLKLFFRRKYAKQYIPQHVWIWVGQCQKGSSFFFSRRLASPDSSRDVWSSPEIVKLLYIQVMVWCCPIHCVKNH